MKTGPKIAIILGVVVIAAGAGLYAFRDKILPGSNAGAAADPVGVVTVKVARGDLTASVAASGQFQPNTITTIRPDSNMPTRKLVTILVKEGQRVTAGQALAQVDPSGLDLDLKSAQANYQAQLAKLDNIKAKPADLDIAAAQASLQQSQANREIQQQNYDNTKALTDKGLASKNQLIDADRQLTLAKTNLNAAELSYQNVKAQSQADVLQSQEASVAQADSSLQKAQLIFDSATIRSPASGMVAEIGVNVGDLVGPSTALMTVINPNPMWLQAQVNENDMVQIKVGQTATVTPSGYPDMVLQGRVTQLDLHAQVQGNVSVFTTTIEVPNRDGKLLWGMNADAEISVLSVKNVLTLPSSAVKTTNGSSQVTIVDGGQLIAWDVQTGATDGTKTEIVAGLDEGTEVVLKQSKSAATNATSQQRQGDGGGPDMGGIFRIMR
jgi:HlyD family secretion protein